MSHKRGWRHRQALFVFLFLLVIVTGLPIWLGPSPRSPLTVQPAWATPILYDNFENWNENAWTIDASSQSSVDITDEVVYSGNYALNCTIVDTGTSLYARIIKDVSAQTTGYVGAYFNSSALPSNAYYFKWLGVSESASGKSPASLLINKNATDAYWQLEYRYGDNLGSSSSVYSATPDLAVNTWYQIKLKVVMDSANGEVKLWIDGDLVFDVTGLDNDLGTGFNRVTLGIVYDWEGKNHTLILDNFKMDTADFTWSTTPVLSSAHYNSTRAGNLTQFRSDWTCDIAELDYAWFESNNTGSPANSSAISLSGTADTALFNVALTSTVGDWVSCRWHANSSTGDAASSDWFLIQTSSVPPSLLHTDGRYVKDQNGNIVTLHGVNIRDWIGSAVNGTWGQINTTTEWSGNWNPDLVQLHLDAMKVWNISAVRFHINIEYFITNKQGYVDHIKDLATWTSQRGIYLIIDTWNVNGSLVGHDSLPYPPYAVNATGILADDQAYVDFMVDLARNFTAYPNVIHGMHNEPVGSQASWFGTALTLGVAERAMFAMRNYTDQIIMIQHGYMSLPQQYPLYSIDSWAPLINFNQSANLVLETHLYRDGFMERYGYTPEAVHANMTSCGIIDSPVHELPVIVGEIGCNQDAENLAQEEAWFQNSLDCFNEHGVGYLIWHWAAYAGYRVFNYTQAYISGSTKWGWIPETYYAGSIFVASANTRPFVWTVGNEKLRGYNYLYSNNTVWSSSWDAVQLTVTYSGNCEVRVFWNVSDSYPINSTLRCLHSNGTRVDALDHYDSGTSLIRLNSLEGSTWILGYSSDSPEYAGSSVSTTLAGQTAQFSAQWLGEAGLSYGILSHNASDSWVNRTAISLSGTSDLFEDSFVLPTEVGKVLGYRFYANDTLGQWGDSGILTLTTTAQEEEEQPSNPDFASNVPPSVLTGIRTSISSAIVLTGLAVVVGFAAFVLLALKRDFELDSKMVSALIAQMMMIVLCAYVLIIITNTLIGM